MVDVQVRIKWSEPNNWSSGEWNKTIVVLHETVTRETEDGAEKVAGWFNDPNFDASTQFVIDNRDVIQCVPETAYAWSAGTTANQRGIHIELVSMADQSPSEWSDDYSTAQLKLAAGLVRELCTKYDIPITRLDAGELRAGRSGITGHYDVSHAWHESTHVDIHPDEFPWGRFMQLVAEQEDDMPTGREIHNAVWRRDEMKAPAPYDESDNNEWMPESILRGAHTHSHAAHDAITASQELRSPYLRKNRARKASLRWLVEWAWHYAHGARSNAGQAAQEAAAARNAVAKLDGRLAGLESAIQQLANNVGKPIDMQAVREAAEQGASAALAQLDATVTLDLAADEGETQA